VLQITPELSELCRESSVVLALELASFEALAVATTPSPPQSPVSIVNAGVLEHSSEALFC
jgi:hypothetical protein